MPFWASSLHTLRANRRYISASFFLGAGTVIFINDNVVEVTGIQGSSMAPTLSPDYHETKKEDVVLWRKWNPTRNLQRGAVVHFDNPTLPENFAVKRVIALEGDTVILDRRRRPTVNGAPDTPEAMAWDAWNGRAEVPPGHVWVEGDNLRSSKDSNYYGPISQSLINGRAISVVWPPSKFGATPWEGFKTRTKVIEGKEIRDWTEGLPIELAEIAEPHRPP